MTKPRKDILSYGNPKTTNLDAVLEILREPANQVRSAEGGQQEVWEQRGGAAKKKIFRNILSIKIECKGNGETDTLIHRVIIIEIYL